MSPFEEGLFGPMISDVREGVRAWSGSSVGICKGSGRDCTDYVGTDVAELAPGEYMVRAELRVPEAGEKGTWKVRFQTNCEVVKTSSSGSTSKTTNTTDKEYEVQYAGDEHGSRLSPLQTIKSPSPYGEQTCTYTLTPNHGSPMTGSWKVPAAK